MEYFAGEYDVAVIGAGHAGIEAALSAARLGCKTAIFTMNLDSVGNLPCNPSIGGTAKGHLVREIDALGGEMAKSADRTFLQSRMLNRGKGPAVHSLRVQTDRRQYQALMKHKLELQENLSLKQAEIIDIRVDKNNVVESVVTRTGAVYKVKAVIIATGTYLRGKIYIGDISYNGGPDGLHASEQLSGSLAKLGIKLMRFKTGTPFRLRRSSIDFSGMEVQHGDEKIIPFSFSTDFKLENKLACYITWTNERTHKYILENLHRSPLYSGIIKGRGPRYCPSIEDKVVRFADKERHQVFIEPCGLDTEEVYTQGLSSSLPEEVQLSFLRTIMGFENAEVMRIGYAIEYDCIDPTQLYPTLEFKNISGLYGAGQFNGSSGYEEAAAQGLVAGINAVQKIKGRPPLILDRQSSYIGTLIDDLVTKGVKDPYRMMTSRSEYRLLLRQDNADERLMPIGREIGLISDETWERFLAKTEKKKQELERLKKTVLPPTDKLNQLLVSRGTSEINTGVRMYDLIKRPQVKYSDLEEFDIDRPEISDELAECIDIEIKYEGYIKRQLAQVAEQKRLENIVLPEDIDYEKIGGLRIEAREKLKEIRPVNIGQASRISGVSPADISVLLIYLEKRRKLNGKHTKAD